MTSEFHGFAGELIWPDDPVYATARLVYNRRIDVRPALVARCRGNADVLAALRFARTRGLEIAVRSAGNNYNGYSTIDGGVVIDLGLMRGVRIDAAAQCARVGGGTLTGDVLREAALTELAPCIGIMGATGMGILLGGGFGHLRNRAGWGADNIVAADVVTADGRLVRASVDENPDLLWALRGAGANFGVVTSLDLALHAMPARIVSGAMVWGEDRLEEAMRFLAEFSAHASEDFSMTAWLKLGDDPEAGGVMQAEAPPMKLRNRPTVEMIWCHWGAPARAAAELRALEQGGCADYSSVGPTNFRDFHYRWGATPKRMTWDAVSVSTLNSPAIDVLAGLARTMTLPGAFRCLELFDQRGATAREPAIASAQPRALPAAWSVRPGASSQSAELDAANDAWVQAAMQAVLATDVGIPDACALNSTSFVPSEARIRTHYGAAIDRLLRLKRQWDPDNVFRRNQNVDPTWT